MATFTGTKINETITPATVSEAVEQFQFVRLASLRSVTRAMAA